MVKDAPLENSLKKDVIRYLKSIPQIVHYDRLNSGKIRIWDENYGIRWVELCKKGTPDIYAILKVGTTGHLIFIETKRAGESHGGDQAIFEATIVGMDNIHYLLTYNIKPLETLINTLTGKVIIDEKAIIEYEKTK